MALASTGLDGELQDGGMVWLDLYHRGTGRRDGEVLHILPGMVLRHQSLLQEGQCVVLQLAGSVIGGEELYEVLRCFHCPLCEESTKDHRSRSRLKIPMSGPEEGEAGFEDILEDHLVDMMGGRPTQSKLRPSSLLNPNASTLHHASVRSRGVEQKAMILSLTPASSPPSRPLQPRFCQSNPSLPDPKKELGVIFPCEEDGDAVLRIAREGRRSFFPPQGRTNLSGISWFRSSTIFSAACPSPPQFVLDGPALRDRYTPNVHSKNLSGSCERDVACRTDNFSRSQVEMRLRSFTEIDGDCFEFFPLASGSTSR
ncbi:hypothetical protein GWK47_018611 [Chionoecetes opilio]|uniref:Uncharacterized protein n=1 Tax=Chionoecetes opilio TaxID=41210 RepID=A0A8J5CGD5_CHIOP|nr:hypothetical protein GWK47_018611 [Chionoecetes opilio]